MHWESLPVATLIFAAGLGLLIWSRALRAAVILTVLFVLAVLLPHLI